MTTKERFFKKVNMFGESDCWQWTAGKVNGYGAFHVGGGRITSHRWAYEFFNVKIPPKQIIRHACHNKLCVNPKHLLIGTPKDNSQDMVKAGRHHNQKVTHCPKGHEYNLENTYVNPNSGARKCKTCSKALKTIHREKQRLKKSYLKSLKNSSK